jgi:hypothetical protein
LEAIEPPAEEAKGEWSLLSMELKDAILRNLCVTDQLSLSSTEKDMRSLLTSSVDCGYRRIEMTHLRETQCLVRLMLLTFHGGLEDAMAYKTVKTNRNWFFSSTEEIEIVYNPSDKEFTLPKYRDFLEAFQTLPILPKINKLRVDCSGLRDIAIGEPDEHVEQQQVHEENHKELLQLCRGDSDRMNRIQWWKDRQELTPSVFGAMADCPNVGHLHLTGVAISEETGHMEYFKSMTNLHIAGLISTAPQFARGLYLMEPTSIFSTMAEYLDHLELHDIKDLTPRCFNILIGGPGSVGMGSRKRGQLLSTLILRNCTWNGSPPALNAGSLSSLMSCIDLTGTHVDDVMDAHALECLKTLILTQTGLSRKKRERITAECGARIEVIM